MTSTGCLRVGQQAPDFTATAVVDQEFKTIRLSDYSGKYVVLFFYPLDFTFVCPSEILAFDRKLAEFKKRNCEVIGVSVDSQYTHLAWKSTPLREGGLGDVQFPLVSDLKKDIARAYGVYGTLHCLATRHGRWSRKPHPGDYVFQVWAGTKEPDADGPCVLPRHLPDEQGGL